MEQIALGQTPYMVSRIALGTMTFGAQVDEPIASVMVDYCLDHGVNFIDSANVYNSGAAEEMLGRILRGRRDRAVLATKVGIKMGDGPTESGLSRKAILKGIDDSLRRLQTDYVDLFYLHQPDYSVPLEESLETLDSLVRAGKVRELGASNYAGWQICHMLWLAERNGWQPMRLVQPMYNLLARGIEQEFLPMARHFRLGVIPYNPLAGGMLTGKHQPDRLPAGTRFERMPAYKDRYWNSCTFEAVDQLSQIAREYGKSLVELAYSWLITQTGVTSVIVGASQLTQLHQNVKAAESGSLPPDALAACDKVWNRLRGVSPVYNR